MRKNTATSSSFLFPSNPDGDTFAYERSLRKQGLLQVAGVDEAGRGPLAGPVVAGCVILPTEPEAQYYRDSKKLTAKQRDKLYAVLHDSDAIIGVGIADPAEIDRINILQASLLAMQRAVLDCGKNGGVSPDFLLVDGTFKVPMELPQQALTKGESKSASIAAASIIAKVTRDRLMAEYHLQYPQYNFQQHKGYPTKAHRAALAKFGPSPLHRKTFKGVVSFSPDEQAEQKCLWNK
ncbi:ribonuclease HII [Desulfobulbus sp. US2]|nr:ribonuclease HII [Desulfobulbus sp. US4]MCW5207259.1 ribonuclease HII [Desulfobulbus sp. US2]MCW5214662.1 ribonuclease HII [Desulfobulbus sp. US5]WLE97198.1 MAG: ribonuclease HII [Candidatus Electrothrix communis]